MSTLLLTERFSTIVCANCSMAFAVPERFETDRRKGHQTFYCPAGHPQSFRGKSEAEQLRDQLAREKHWREQAEERVRDQRLEAERITLRLNATRGVVTRQKRKIARGQCPCCTRKFKDLAVHMREEHPNWNPDAEAAAMEARS